MAKSVHSCSMEERCADGNGQACTWEECNAYSRGGQYKKQASPVMWELKPVASMAS